MIRAVLFDRDGTLIADGAAFALMPGAVAAIARLRSRGLRIGVVTNQPRVGKDPAARRAMQAVHRRIEARVGELDGWFVCTHAASAGCLCRKPQPGLIHQAAREFGIAPRDCVVVGDIGSDVEAARRAGAQAILVPTPVTLPNEVTSAQLVCSGLPAAVDCILARVAA